VFIPLLFMGGIIGRQFHEFSVTLSVAILVSAVVSLTLTPMLCSRWLRKEKPEQTQGWFYRAAEKIYNGMLGFYSRSLRWVLRILSLCCSLRQQQSVLRSGCTT